jgi:lipopolysaccharide transport system ATP-binding protein
VAEEEGREHREEKEERQRREAADDGGGEDGGSEDGGKGEGARGSEGAGRRERRWGSREAQIVAARRRAGPGAASSEPEERYHLTSGEPVAFEIDVDAPHRLADFVFGIRVTTPRGAEVWGTNTHLAGLEPAALAGRATARLVCPALRLAPGEYLLDVAVHSRDGAPYDYWSHALGFTVTARDRGVGVYFPEHRWEVEGEVSWKETR